MPPLRAILQFCPKKRKDSLCALAATLDGRQAVSGSGDKTLCVWDLATWETKTRLQGHASFISTVAITHDGCRVVSGSNDKSLPAWDPQLEKPKTILQGRTTWMTKHIRVSRGLELCSCKRPADGDEQLATTGNTSANRRHSYCLDRRLTNHTSRDHAVTLAAIQSKCDSFTIQERSRPPI